MFSWINKIIKHNTTIQYNSNESYGTGELNLLQEIANRRKTDTLLNTVLTLNIGFTTGSGYFLESESNNESQKEALQEWIDLTDFEDSIYSISEDLLAAGNAFILVQDNSGVPRCVVLPLDAVNVTEHDDLGQPAKYGVSLNGTYNEYNASEIIHATWRKGSDGYGKGIASAAAQKGTGYFSNSGQRVRKQNYFETREGILDLSLKAYAASLPRYLATTSNANQESVNALSTALAKLEPLSSLAVSDDISIQEMSLDSKSKIDAMIQVLNQEDVTALASPIQQMWSLRGHSWAAARESVRVMMPFLHSFEITVEKVINRIFKMVIADTDVKISFSAFERPTIDQVKTVTDIVNSNPSLAALVDPEKILAMINDVGYDLKRDDDVIEPNEV